MRSCATALFVLFSQLIAFIFLFIAGIPSDVEPPGKFNLQLTGPVLGYYDNPVWSPDGRSLAFSIRKGYGDAGLWIYDFETDSYTSVWEGDSVPRIEWQGNDRVTMLNALHLSSIDIHTGEQTILWDDVDRWEWYSIDPTNPDRIIIEKRSASLLNPWQPSDLYEIDLHTGGETRLTDTPDVSEEDPTICADGQTLIYDEIRGVVVRTGEGATEGTREIIVRDENGNRTLLSRHGMCITPDARIFAFEGAYDIDAGLFVFEITEQNRVVPVLTGRDLKSDILAYSWSPANGRLAIALRGYKSNQLLITDPIDLDALFASPQ